MPDAPLPAELPLHLSETGLYSDFANKVVADGTIAFAPVNVLWSDAAVKLRWLQLPPGAKVNTAVMDHWEFPVGTRLFKEFSLDGKRLETRIIWRVRDTGNREVDTLLGAYVWDDTESEATFAPMGADNLRGTEHDAPSADTCWRCHVGESGHILGFSALQLGTLDALPLTDPPPAGTVYAAPNPALGYLHANCGHCHNPNGSGWVDSKMILRLDVDETDATTSKAYQTTVGVALTHWIGNGYTDRIVAGDPDASAIPARMASRDHNVQMPPIATEFVDDDGVALVRAWIQSL
jgi:mono/diheme cytochrome c family protein